MNIDYGTVMGKRLTFKVIITLAVFILSAISQSEASSSSQESSDKQDALITANNAIGRYIGDYTLTDQDGKDFRLKKFAGKPLVISFIYRSCGNICPTITMNLENTIKEAGKDFGVKFNAITISLDADNDTPQRMKEYGSNFTNDFKSWRFATADKDTIDRLAKDIGFYYKKIDGGFDHLNLTTIVDKDGKIYKQVYGMDFEPHEILQPIYQALSEKGTPSKQSLSIIDRIKLFCSIYDEGTGTYKADYTSLMALMLGIIIHGVFVLLMIYIFCGRHTKKAGFDV